MLLTTICDDIHDGRVYVDVWIVFANFIHTFVCGRLIGDFEYNLY